MITSSAASTARTAGPAQLSTKNNLFPVWFSIHSNILQNVCCWPQGPKAWPVERGGGGSDGEEQQQQLEHGQDVAGVK